MLLVVAIIRSGSSRKNFLGGHGHGDKRERRGSGVKPPANCFDHALFVLRKRLIGHLYTKKL